MKTLPTVTGRDEFDALIIRTDYDDDKAWLAVVAALTQPWGGGEFEARVHLADDPAWAGASADEVLAAVAGDEYLGVLFIADRATMQEDDHALLAVTTVTREDLGDEQYEAMTEYGREFRTIPVGVHDIYANLHIANMDFEEFAAAAQEDPDGVYRSF
jgi:hypothetical protein